MFLACIINDPTSKVSILWEVLAITVFFSAGELLISALGLSLMAKASTSENHRLWLWEHGL